MPLAPGVSFPTGDRTAPHVYLVDNGWMLADIGNELPPLRVWVLEHINDARAETGLPTLDL